MSDSEKNLPVPVEDRTLPIRWDNMTAAQSSTADFPAPLIPARTLIRSEKSNESRGMPRNPSISIDRILTLSPERRHPNGE